MSAALVLRGCCLQDRCRVAPKHTNMARRNLSPRHNSTDDEEHFTDSPVVVRWERAAVLDVTSDDSSKIGRMNGFGVGSRAFLSADSEHDCESIKCRTPTSMETASEI